MMPVSINHSSSSYLPVTSPSKSTYRPHYTPTPSYKSSYSSYPSSRYLSYTRTLSDDSGLSVTGTSCVRSTDSQDSALSRYSKARSSSGDSSSSALKSYSSSTITRKSTPSRYLSDLNDVSVSDIRLRFSSLSKNDSIRPSKQSPTYTRPESSLLLPLAGSRKSTSSTLDSYQSEDGNRSKDLVKSSPLHSGSSTTAVPPGGRNGLRNIGNTCFLNSVVQCLSNTPELKDYLLNDEYLNDIDAENKGDLIKSFAALIKELWQGENKTLNPTAFKGHIQRFAPRFMGYSQQDAQEFLRYLLDGLHEDLNRVKERPKEAFEIDDNMSEQTKAYETWRQYLRCQNSKIVDLFAGQMKSTLKCTYCDHCSTTYEPFWDLSLPFPSRTGNININQCLELYCKKEVMDGKDMPTCSSCKVLRKCTKALTVQRLPTILVLHLKRFCPERLIRKLSAHVDFPLKNLNMAPYMDPSVKSNGTPLYDLYAVANHNGSVHSGHYTAYCQQPRSDTWYHYNDTCVSPISSRHVVSSEAYVLFYRQNGQQQRS